VDGKFEIEKKDLKLKFRGSSNQRIIDLKKTLDSKEIILLEI
jgi:anaerobic ribonucleoside-triphosphate reductase activating protein